MLFSENCKKLRTHENVCFLYGKNESSDARKLKELSKFEYDSDKKVDFC